MKKLLFFMGCLICCFLFTVSFSWAESVRPSKIKSAYLDTIYEDVEFLVEGIELFVKRDYPFYWENIESGKNIPSEIVESYVLETSNFRSLLDSHLKEFVAYKNVSEEKEPIKKEKDILQMLSYAYLSTGNFITARALVEEDGIMDVDTEINISKLNGRKVKFNLTKVLKERLHVIGKNLDLIKLDLRYFFPEDIETIDAYIEVKGSDFTNPLNLMYAHAYRGVIPYNKSTGDCKISLNMLLSFLKNIRYFDLMAKGEDKQAKYKNRNLSFFLLKGQYSLTSASKGLRIDKLSDNSFNIEKKFLFKGLKYRGLRFSGQQETNLVNLVDEGSKEYLKDSYCQYGRYKITMNSDDLGYVQVIPCYRNTCVQADIEDTVTTPVKIYGHTLVLFEDIVDQVKVNMKQKEKVFYAEEKERSEIEDNKSFKAEAKADNIGDTKENIETDKTKAGEPEKNLANGQDSDKKEDVGLGKSEEKVHLFRGCSPKVSSVF